MGHRMTKLEVAKIKILTRIVRKLEPSKAEYTGYERQIRKSKLDSRVGYNAALGFCILSRAITRTIDHFIVFMIRALIIAVVISIITISYN